MGSLAGKAHALTLQFTDIDSMFPGGGRGLCTSKATGGLVLRRQVGHEEGARAAPRIPGRSRSSLVTRPFRKDRFSRNGASNSLRSTLVSIVASCS